jgi:Lactate dehydrogenase and related dehydrogenases
MNFNKIVQLDSCGLVSPYREKIFNLSVEPPLIYDSPPKNNKEIIERISDADCVLVSWNTKINAEVINSVPNVKYIGMCCSLYDEQSANVNIAEARKHNIVVKGVRDYGDNGTVEFIFAELISLLKGLGTRQWRNEPVELTNKTIGIIGMGVLGKMVARTALHFGMKVVYYSRTRKEEIEKEGVENLSLHKLLSRSEIITTHLPRNTTLLTADNIKYIRNDAIYVNTSLGQPFETKPFLDWIGQNNGNYAIFDSAGYSDLSEVFLLYPNVILLDKSSGFTLEAKERLTKKVWENMVDFLFR